jgi:hypothetical protein
MPEVLYHGRRAAQLESGALRVTVTLEGGHIAEILDKESGINPLWIPPWPSIEPSAFDPANLEYGGGPDARLLAGIMGHNLCLDLFGGPSPEEAAAGMTAHGEGSVASYSLREEGGRLFLAATLPMAQLKFERMIEIQDHAASIRERVSNLSSWDRPIAWTQHVTLGPPFLERGVTRFQATATRSKVYEHTFGAHDYLKAGADFDWPMAPRSTTGLADLSLFTDAPASSAFTTHLMDPGREDAFFLAFHPGLKLAFGYVWKQADFPWLGIWEENHSRVAPPWCGKTLARGMEFGVSPVPETRRQMIERGSLFGVPAYRWIPAKGSISAHYWALAFRASKMPASLEMPASSTIRGFSAWPADEPSRAREP